jgi:drug/metabolite transporter (DMT)-like permease
VTVLGTRAARAATGSAGLALAVLSAATFSTSGTFASALYGAGWSPGTAVLARIGVAAVILTVPAVLQLRGRWPLLRRNARGVAAYSLLAIAGPQLCFFNAVARIPVGIALLLEYLGVVLVVGWLWLRHGQRPRRLTVAGGTVAIAGLAMVLDLAGPGGINPVGVVWALLGAVGLASFFLLSAGGEREPLPPIVMAWAGMCAATAGLAAVGWTGLLPMTASTGSVHMLGHQMSWIVPVLGLSLLAAVIAYVAGIGGARRLGAKLTSFVSLSETLFAILFAWLLLGQLPSAIQFLGGAFILAGVVMVRMDELQPSPGPASPARRPPAQQPGLAPARTGGR